MLCLGFHAFGNHAQAHALAQGDDRADDGFAAGVGQGIENKRLVNLQLAQRQALEVTEGRIAGAEIIQRESHAVLDQ